MYSGNSPILTPVIQFPCLETIFMILIMLCIYKQKHTHTFALPHVLYKLQCTLLFQLIYLKVIPFSTLISFTLFEYMLINNIT